MRNALLVGLLLSVGSSPSSADAFRPFFDGERCGLVVSGGAGLLPAVTLSSRDVQPSLSESAAGVSIGGFAGIGFTDRDVVGFDGHAVFTRQLDARQLQLFAGGTWLHYFAPVDESMFAGLGVGAVRRSTFSGIRY